MLLLSSSLSLSSSEQSCFWCVIKSFLQGGDEIKMFLFFIMKKKVMV